MTPPGDDRGRQDPLLSLGERGEAVLEKAVELRAGGLQHQKVADATHDPAPVVCAGDRRHALLRTGADKRVVVRLAADADVGPGGFVDVHAGAVDGRELADEMPGQPEAEILDVADRVAREGENGVLLGVSRHDFAVVPAEVRLGEIARKRNGDCEVPNFMGPTGLCDPNDMRLRLAVLVVAEDDGHVPL